MMELAIKPDALDAYLRHAVDGLTLEQAADATKTKHRSTILRRVRKVEDMRDQPEWDAILNALEDHRMGFATPPSEQPSISSLCEALGTTLKNVSGHIAKVRHVMSRPNATILTAPDLPTAAIMVGGVAVNGVTVPRNSLLAALALGWVEMSGRADLRVRSYKLTKLAAESGQVSRNHAKHIGNAMIGGTATRGAGAFGVMDRILQANGGRYRAIFTSDHIETGLWFEGVLATKDGLSAADYQSVTNALPPRLMRLLELVLSGDHGFEDIERELGFAARSGKHILAIALECIMQFRSGALGV